MSDAPRAPARDAVKLCRRFAFCINRERARIVSTVRACSARLASTNFLRVMIDLVLDQLLALVQLHQAMTHTQLTLATSWNRESDSKPGYAFCAVISQEPGM